LRIAKTRREQLILSLVATLSLILAMKGPLLTIAYSYDFRLFSDNIFAGAKGVELRRSSQALHVAAAIIFPLVSVLGGALLLTPGNSSMRHGFRSLQSAVILIAAALYTCAAGTLLAFMLRLKDNVDRLPIPTDPQTWHVSLRYGAYFEILGLVCAITSSGYALCWLTGAERRRAYSEIQ
jgi:hypothetical protein